LQYFRFIGVANICNKYNENAKRHLNVGFDAQLVNRNQSRTIPECQWRSKRYKYDNGEKLQGYAG